MKLFQLFGIVPCQNKTFSGMSGFVGFLEYDALPTRQRYAGQQKT